MTQQTSIGTPIIKDQDRGKSPEELGLVSDNDWQVSQETIDQAEAIKRQNAINVSKIKDMPND